MIRKQACISVIEHIACRAVPELEATGNVALPVLSDTVNRQVNKGIPHYMAVPRQGKKFIQLL